MTTKTPGQILKDAFLNNHGWENIAKQYEAAKLAPQKSAGQILFEEIWALDWEELPNPQKRRYENAAVRINFTGQTCEPRVVFSAADLIEVHMETDGDSIQKMKAVYAYVVARCKRNGIDVREG